MKDVLDKQNEVLEKKRSRKKGTDASSISYCLVVDGNLFDFVLGISIDTCGH